MQKKLPLFFFGYQLYLWLENWNKYASQNEDKNCFWVSFKSFIVKFVKNFKHNFDQAILKCMA